MALKVYRTPIGFHDAYVAAPSQMAALAAWGSDADLFARGVAEVVTDEALTAEPLARPGEVVKRLRGTADEQLAAAPPRKKERPPRVARVARVAVKSPVKAGKASPRPKRDAVDKADAALAAAESVHRDADQALAVEEQALADRRRRLRTDWLTERDRLEGKRDEAEARYAAALKTWQADQP